MADWNSVYTAAQQAQAERRQSQGDGFHSKFKVYRWSESWQPVEEWRWLPIPTYPACESVPYASKEAARQAGEKLGFDFDGYEE